MNNVYKQDRDASAEILRLALQKMGAQPASFTPHAYAVWYEFIAGINPPLAEALNALLAGDGKLTTEKAQDLFDRYVAEGNPEAEQVFRRNMHRLLDGLAAFAASTGLATERFGSDLQKYGVTLTGTLDDAAMRSLIGELTRDTLVMRDSVNTLQGKLQESQGEIEKLQQELQQARSEALFDPMTRVLNRRGFDAQMKKLIGRPEMEGKRVSFLMIDIDFFKKINDSYGHLFGDRVICGIAEILTAQVKGQDSVARLGGEEFAVILPDTPPQGAFAAAENIRRHVANSKIRRLDLAESVGGVTVSIGVADCAIAGDWAAAVKNADEALYVSKHQGRNRTTIYAAD